MNQQLNLVAPKSRYASMIHPWCRCVREKDAGIKVAEVHGSCDAALLTGLCGGLGIVMWVYSRKI